MLSARAGGMPHSPPWRHFAATPRSRGGATTLEFDQAFNPFCAVNDFVLCAVVPVENRPQPPGRTFGF